MKDPTELFEHALCELENDEAVPARRGQSSLELGVRAVRGRRQRRRAARAVATLTIVACAWLLTVAWRDTQPAGDVAPALPRHESSARHWQVVADLPGTAERLAVTAVATRVQRDASTRPSSVRQLAPRTTRQIDDSELGEWLRRGGRTPARIRVGDEVLVPAAVE